MLNLTLNNKADRLKDGRTDVQLNRNAIVVIVNVLFLRFCLHYKKGAIIKLQHLFMIKKPFFQHTNRHYKTNLIQFAYII